MLRLVFAALLLAGTWVAPSLAQAPAEGQAIFESKCAMCHKADGSGTGSVFPALSGNENLADASYIVAMVHGGGSVMPPFPTLTDAEIAAVASYVRGAWGNSFGEVSEEEVASARAELEPAGPVSTIWDGVYTQEQADRGKAVFTSPCGLCHGTRLNGAPDDQDMPPAPPLAREKFLRVWDGRSLGALYSYTRATMPKSNPGFLTDEQYLDIIAHMLSVTGAPAGSTELPADVKALAHIIVAPKP